MFARLAIAVAMLVFAGAAGAAEIKTDGRVVWVTGPLVAADGERFKVIALAVGDGATIVLESDGGSAGAAIAIGEEIKRRGFATAVLAHKTCASACGFIWLAGKPRIMDKQARLGFHAVYLVEQGKVVSSTAANAVMGSYLGSIGIPAAAIYFVTSAGPDGMNWMTQDIAHKLGVDVLVFDAPTTEDHPLFGRKRKLVKSEESDLNWALPVERIPVPELAPRGTTVVLPDRVGQLAYVYIEQQPGPPAGHQGSVVWRVEQGPLGKRLVGWVSVPDIGFNLAVVFEKNTDASLPASFLWEFKFQPWEGDGDVIAVQRINLKKFEPDRGQALYGVAAPKGNNVHWFAMHDTDVAKRANRELLIENPWIDIPVRMQSNRRALITLSFGDVGRAALDEVFATATEH